MLLSMNTYLDSSLNFSANFPWIKINSKVIHFNFKFEKIVAL